MYPVPLSRTLGASDDCFEHPFTRRPERIPWPPTNLIRFLGRRQEKMHLINVRVSPKLIRSSSTHPFFVGRTGQTERKHSTIQQSADRAVFNFP